jgi:hypothetical protein
MLEQSCIYEQDSIRKGRDAPAQNLNRKLLNTFFVVVGKFAFTVFGQQQVCLRGVLNALDRPKDGGTLHVPRNSNKYSHDEIGTYGTPNQLSELFLTQISTTTLNRSFFTRRVTST